MEGFSFQYELVVRVTDLNYGGHVGNARVLDYFQEARLAYLVALGGFTELDIGGPGLILPEAHVVYLKEMFGGDVLSIGVRAGEVGNSSFRLDYRIERDGTAVAEGHTVLVAFNYERRKPVRLPEMFRQGLIRNGNGTKQ